MSMAHEEVFSTEMLIHSLRANAAEERDEEAAGIQIILADRLAYLAAALADRDRRLAEIAVEARGIMAPGGFVQTATHISSETIRSIHAIATE